MRFMLSCHQRHTQALIQSYSRCGTYRFLSIERNMFTYRTFKKKKIHALKYFYRSVEMLQVFFNQTLGLNNCSFKNAEFHSLQT